MLQPDHTCWKSTPATVSSPSGAAINPSLDRAAYDTSTEAQCPACVWAKGQERIKALEAERDRLREALKRVEKLRSDIEKIAASALHGESKAERALNRIWGLAVDAAMP